MLYPFLLPLVVWCIIQIIKIIVDAIHLKTFHRKWLWWAGWFPSVHSGLTSSIVTIVWFHLWIWSIEFMMVFWFAFLFWYDAMHVRYEAGKHAHQINSIRHELQSVLTVHTGFQMLKERIWHTPLEVTAGIVGGVLLTLGLLQIISIT